MDIQRILDDSEAKRGQLERESVLKQDQEQLRQRLNLEKVEQYLQQSVKPFLHQVQADLVRNNRKCELNVIYCESTFKSFIVEVKMSTDRFPLNSELRSWIRYTGSANSAVIDISMRHQDSVTGEKQFGTFALEKISKEIVESCMDQFLKEIIC